MHMLTLLDCTFRDGGYYNAWDFAPSLIEDYLIAMKAAQVDVVELGFRFVENRGFKGPCAYTTDAFIRSLTIPEGLTVGVMMNGADLCTPIGPIGAVERLFPDPAAAAPVDLVRFACHFRELPQALQATDWLAQRGYRIGLNLMQIADRSRAEVEDLARMAADAPVDLLYFADSMGSMTPDDTARIIGWLRAFWSGPLGIHTHDNLGLALANTLRAQAEGVTWLDATVTGMGRGPGNARIEELVIEAETLRGRKANLVPLMALIRKYFAPMKAQYGWGTNPYYYLAGKYGIHPTYIQEMLGDARYDEEDSQRSHLCAASHDFDDPGFPLTGAPIAIGDGAWVAAEAFLGPGVTIGARAVVLARSVVVRDVLPGAVVGGNPARHLRERAPHKGEDVS